MYGASDNWTDVKGFTKSDWIPRPLKPTVARLTETSTSEKTKSAALVEFQKVTSLSISANYRYQQTRSKRISTTFYASQGPVEAVWHP